MLLLWKRDVLQQNNYIYLEVCVQNHGASTVALLSTLLVLVHLAYT